MRVYEVNYFRAFWLGIYVLASIAVAYIFAVRGQLGGDFEGVPLSNFHTLLVATSSVVVSYLVWMGPVFRMMEKITVLPLFKHWQDAASTSEVRLISVLVFFLQLSFLTYCLVQGIGIAGSTKRVELLVKYVWVLLPVDAIFLIYYGLYRRSRWIFPNLAIYILSNALRGWFGFWLIIFFIEGAHRIREKRFDWKKISLVLALFVWLIPFLIELKWTIRKYGFSHLVKGTNFQDVMQSLDWWYSIKLAMDTTLMRLQHLDNVIVIINNSALLIEKIRNREFLYFFEEGLPQFTLERLLNLPRTPDIHLKLIDYFAVFRVSLEGVVSNTHTGLVGWLWITPNWCLLYLLYVLLLSWCGIWLSKKLGGSGLLVEVTWFAILTLLMNGWFGAYIEFLQAMLVVILARVLISKTYQHCSILVGEQKEQECK